MQPISTTRPACAFLQCVATMYANKSNVIKIVRLYEALFACKQGSRSLQEYYGAMESIINDLTIYQHASTDPNTLTRYRDELRAGAFLSGLKPELANMIRGQLLGGSRVMPIDEIFSATIRVHDSVPPSSISSSVDASALVVYEGSGGPPKFVGKGASMGRLRNSFPPCKYYGKMSHQAKKMLEGVREAHMGPSCLRGQDHFRHIQHLKCIYACCPRWIRLSDISIFH